MGKHYVTLSEYNPEQFMGSWEPKVMEPNKCEEWRWFKEAPSPLFLPIQNLLATGFKLWKP